MYLGSIFIFLLSVDTICSFLSAWDKAVYPSTLLIFCIPIQFFIIFNPKFKIHEKYSMPTLLNLQPSATYQAADKGRRNVPG